MFDKETLDKFWDDLKGRYGAELDWTQILKDAHLGIGRSDAGVDLGSLDPRVVSIIEEHRA